MPLLSSARSIGVIGSILTILLIVPGTGTFLAVVGWVLIIVAVYQISRIASAPQMFTNVVVAAVLAVAGLAVAAVVLVGAVLRFVTLNGLGSLSRLNATSFSGGGSPHPVGIVGLVFALIGGLALLWVFFIASAFFLRRGYEEMAKRFNVRMFGTAALVYLIGAVLTIVVVGLVLIFVAEILQVVAFYSLPDQVPGQEERPTPMTVPPPPPAPA